MPLTTATSCATGWPNAAAATSSAIGKTASGPMTSMLSRTSGAISSSGSSAASKTSGASPSATIGSPQPSLRQSASPPRSPNSSNDQMSLGHSHADEKFITVASTTSTENSGLFAY